MEPARHRIGIMGGTFDPIHHGHLVAASEVTDLFGLDEVVFVPTGQPWQKSGVEVSPAEDRYLMTVIATASNPRFHVSRVDIERSGPTYTVDTLRDLRTAYGTEAELYFITGADALGKILSWKDADQIFALAHFVGVTRPGFELSDAHLPADAATLVHGDLVDRLPGAGRRRQTGLVPGARRRCAVHRKATSVPKSPGDVSGGPCVRVRG
jgi:nicotinate-nucleotide adenylyltransferase